MKRQPHTHGSLMFLLAFAVIGVGLIGCAAPKRVIRQPPSTETSAATPAPRRVPPSPAEPALPPAGTDGALGPGQNVTVGLRAAGLASEQIGRPYRPGGRSTSGFDCSGLVQFVYGEVGIALPRMVRDQSQVGGNVIWEGLIPGDLLFFKTEGSRISHVGIYTGGGAFVHAPGKGKKVRKDNLASEWWRQRLVLAKRVY